MTSTNVHLIRRSRARMYRSNTTHGRRKKRSGNISYSRRGRTVRITRAPTSNRTRSVVPVPRNWVFTLMRGQRIRLIAPVDRSASSTVFTGVHTTIRTRRGETTARAAQTSSSAAIAKNNTRKGPSKTPVVVAIYISYLPIKERTARTPTAPLSKIRVSANWVPRSSATKGASARRQ